MLSLRRQAGGGLYCSYHLLSAGDRRVCWNEEDHGARPCDARCYHAPVVAGGVGELVRRQTSCPARILWWTIRLCNGTTKHHLGGFLSWRGCTAPHCVGRGRCSHPHQSAQPLHSHQMPYTVNPLYLAILHSMRISVPLI